jgi:hypothetical protein
MRVIKVFAIAAILLGNAAGTIMAKGKPATQAPLVAVGPQYGATHVYVAPEDFDRFGASVVATFGGAESQPAVITITPTPSETISRRSAVSLCSASRRRSPIPLASSERAISSQTSTRRFGQPRPMARTSSWRPFPIRSAAT